MRFSSCFLTSCALATVACSSPALSESGEPLERRTQPAKKGDLIVTEIYPNPVGATEDNKEWFEVYNTTDAPIDLDGWTFKDDKNSALLTGTAIVPPKGYAVIGQSKDKAINGGIQVDVEYGGKIGLSSTADEIHLIDPGGVEIDVVSYNTVAPWPPKTKGAAIQLDPSSFSSTENDDGGNWCLATTSYGTDGGLGTPGKANDPCGGGTGGAAGSGGGGAGTAGSVGTGGAAGSGMAGAGGDVGTGGAAGSGQGGTGGSGTAGTGTGGTGQGGRGGAPSSCQVRFHKIDLNQPDPPGAPKDAFEAVELQVEGAFQAGVTTLASCGVATVNPFDAAASDAGVCGAKAGYYHELAVGDLVIPASGFVVVGNIPASDRPWNNADGTPATVLQNGPDYLVLRGPDGGIIDAISYADNDAPDLYADCAQFSSAMKIPADANTKDSPALNQVLALCQDGTWKLLLESQITWKSPNPCGTGGTGGAGGSGAGGSGVAGSGGTTSGGGSGSGTGGSGGTGQAGADGTGAGGSSAGGSTQGGGGTSSGPGVGGSSQAGSSAASSPASPGTTGEDGDCSCQTTGAPGSGQGALALLGLAALVIRRRRGA
ncbi:MAG: lamin tail domain-containing protein [Myxococcales bacterium]|nr:lamin tail domain-containing protein [Polyangiaceae bacterium]MDW8247814.1 lamin tail domain-containing protein [Myxococcales bacterium]